MLLAKELQWRFGFKNDVNNVFSKQVSSRNLGFSEAGVVCYQVTHNLRYKISNIQPDQYYKFECIH